VARVLLAGGGTVGHLAPGFAVRDALRDLGHEATFVTPGEAREEAWFPAGEPRPDHVPAPRLPKTLWGKVAFPFRMARAVLVARRLLRRTQPVAVLALGGWPCAPTAIAALTKGVPLHLVAVDAVPGSVVRRLQRRATWTWLARAEALGALPAPERARVVGPLVRRDVAAGRRDPARFGLVEGRRTLLVVGGSLGARGLNERVRAGLESAVRADSTLAERVQVIHATGTEEEAERSRATFHALGLVHCTRPFVAEIGDAFRTADLVLCRGGASTLAEAAALRRPLVVVPYPHHADRQQWRNAEPLVAAGRAVLVEEGDLDPDRFRSEVLARLLDDQALATLARGVGAPVAAAEGEGDAAATIALELVRSIRGTD
jgi:UDP-N-acetylglucosamine--N-acetylmuramyl-(pentapeptide) pyrophosphoryl-undecaprenol N-acetylglucosamine transferase